jgi:uncharacterized protein
MSIEENKRVARSLFERFDANDLAGALDLLADDVTWWMAGKPDHIPIAGTHDKQRFAAVIGRMMSQLENGLRMTVTSAIAEGDEVALQVVSHGVLGNGRVYENEYHFAMTVRDGKIHAVREYLDTQHVVETWFRP